MALNLSLKKVVIEDITHRRRILNYVFWRKISAKTAETKTKKLKVKPSVSRKSDPVY